MKLGGLVVDNAVEDIGVDGGPGVGALVVGEAGFGPVVHAVKELHLLHDGRLAGLAGAQKQDLDELERSGMPIIIWIRDARWTEIVIISHPGFYGELLPERARDLPVALPLLAQALGAPHGDGRQTSRRASRREHQLTVGLNLFKLAYR